jgi:hypothetical protein
VPVVRTSHAGVNSKLLAPRKIYEISKYFNRALVAALEGSKSSAKHSNPALSHTVLQLWPLCPIFHCWTPATVHSSSVELAMLLINPVSPEATTGAYLPAVQAMQSVSPAAEYLPAAQAMQVLATEAPVAVEYFPATHSRQTLAPSAAEYVPAAHAMQVLFEEAPLVEEYVPAAQLVQTVATAAEYVPAVQSLQSAARASECVPVGQLVQTEALA